MDVSKLPKLSQSPPPPPNKPDDDPPPAAPMAHPMDQQPTPRAVQFADVWIGIGIGVVLLFFAPRFWQWALSLAGIGTFPPFTKNGVVIPYHQTEAFLGDLAVFMFSLVLILDGILAAMRRPVILLRFAIFLTVCTTLLNLYYVASMYSMWGPQFLPLLAFIFGVYIMTIQLSHLKLARAARRKT